MGVAMSIPTKIIYVWNDYFLNRVILVVDTGESLAVPYDFFEPSGDGTKPDFTKASVDDWGQALCLGPYESSADVILWTFHQEYRDTYPKLESQQEKKDEN